VIEQALHVALLVGQIHRVEVARQAEQLCFVERIAPRISHRSMLSVV